MYLVYPPSSRGSIPLCMSAATQYLVVNLFSEKEVDWFTFMCSQVWLDCWQLEMKVLPLQKDFSQFSILDLHKADHSIPANLGPWQFQISVDLSSISADWQGDDVEEESQRSRVDPWSYLLRSRLGCLPPSWLFDTFSNIGKKKCKITLSLKYLIHNSWKSGRLVFPTCTTFQYNKDLVRCLR